ncbi:MAG: hypothetical protein ACYSTF_03290 [Planctomycetota bacterium]|jgi:hypothetical protein
MKARRYWVLVLVLLLEVTSSNGICLGTEEERFHGWVNGYSFVVPHGWTQIPYNVVQQNAKLALSTEGQSRVSYEAAFQHHSAKRWFQYPYVLVQVMKYSKLGIDRQVRDSEIRQITKAVSGLDTTDLVEETLVLKPSKWFLSLASVSCTLIPKIDFICLAGKPLSHLSAW